MEVCFSKNILLESLVFSAYSYIVYSGPWNVLKEEYISHKWGRIKLDRE